MSGSRLLVVAFALFAAAGAARAATIARVDIRGVDEAMTANVRDSLSLVDSIGRDVSGRRLAYLVRVAEAETRSALEPFGYYSPQIEVQRTPAGAGGTQAVAITVTVRAGEPVRVRRSHVAIQGEGVGDRALREELDAFVPTRRRGVRPGRVRRQQVAHQSPPRRRAVTSMPTSPRRTVEVTRAANAADIDLVWNSGVRYDMGDGDIHPVADRSSAARCWTNWCTGRRALPTSRATWIACANRWWRSTISAASTSSRIPTRPSTAGCRSRSR